MKKLLILGTLLALLAVLAVPMAAFAADVVVVNGTYTAATIVVSPPGTMNFGTFQPGVNVNVMNSPGWVTVTNNSQNPTGWTLNAKDLSTQYGWMWDGGSNFLAIKLRIALDSNAWQWADTGDSWASGPTSGAFMLYARQDVVNTDVPATYGITITFTGSLSF